MLLFFTKKEKKRFDSCWQQIKAIRTTFRFDEFSGGARDLGVKALHSFHTSK